MLDKQFQIDSESDRIASITKNMSCKEKAKPVEICRMSWFLIEMDEGQSKGGKINGRIAFGIIHSMDIIDNESTYMYINRKVRFNWNHAIMEGRVKMASDDRSYLCGTTIKKLGQE